MTTNEVTNHILSYLRYDRQFIYVATEVLECDIWASNGKDLVEVEVKVSWDDYKVEWQKNKHKHCRNGVSESKFRQGLAPHRKYFAAPIALAQKISLDLTAHHQFYGVLAVSDKGQVTVIRRPKRLHDLTIRPRVLELIVGRISSELITMRQKVRR